MEVIALERVGGGGGVPPGRRDSFTAAVVVTGEHERVALAGGLEPGAGEAMAGRAVARGQRRVGGVADQAVAKRVLSLSGELAGAAALDELGGAQLLERLVDWRGEQHLDAGRPEARPVHAGGSQGGPRVIAEAIEARLQHAQDGVGDLAVERVAGRGGADQFLEQERVTAGALDQLGDRRVGDPGAEDLADQLLGGLAV